MRKTKKVLVGGIVGLLATALAACGDAPEEEKGGNGGEATAPDYTPCIVSDAGGFDDK